MPGHTKRTEAFKVEIMELANGLMNNTLSHDERTRLIVILGRNTTDSPCIVKALENEPIFVLRSHDSSTAELISRWAEKFRTWMANARLSKEQEESAYRKWVDAVECSAEFREYPHQKLPS